MIKLWKATLGLLLVLPAVSAAQAETIVLWDSGIAAEVRAQLEPEAACDPYAPHRPQCVEGRLRLGQNDDEGERLSAIDQIALFVYRYKDLDLEAEPQPGTRLKLTTALLSLYQQQLDVRLELRIRF